jgi:hypothetical protein
LYGCYACVAIVLCVFDGYGATDSTSDCGCYDEYNEGNDEGEYEGSDAADLSPSWSVELCRDVFGFVVVVAICAVFMDLAL